MLTNAGSMKYKCKKNGSTTHKGKYIQYTKGENDVPDGALDHVGGCKVITQSKKTVVESSAKRKPTDGTVKEIKAWLDDNGIDYPSNALKAELIEILKNA